MTLAGDLVDGLADDLDANAGLPPHKTIRHRRPRAILPEVCPALVVWLAGKRADRRTTEQFGTVLVLGVSWHEEAVEEAETLIQDVAVATALEEALEAIEARVRTLAVGPLLPGAWEVMPGDVDYVGPLLQQGLTEGYALEVLVRATETE